MGVKNVLDTACPSTLKAVNNWTVLYHAMGPNKVIRGPTN